MRARASRRGRGSRCSCSSPDHGTDASAARSRGSRSRRRRARRGRPRAASSVSHHTPRPTLAPEASAATATSDGVPAAALANHGAATISTNVSTTSLRQTNELHSGCSPARIRPTTTHLASDGDDRGDARRRRAAPTPDSGDGDHATPSVDDERLRARTARDARCATVTTPARTGTARRRPARRAGAAAGRNVRLSSTRRPRGDGASPAGSRATTYPAFDFSGAADSTATSAVFGHRAARRAAMPELPRNARLPTLARPDPQPAAAELVGGDHRVVGQERAVADRGHLRDSRSTVDASTSRADRRRRARAARPA